MKKIIAVIVLLAGFSCYAQDTIPVFNAPSWKAPYSLPLDGWGMERFLLPPDFAPQIKYTGVEDLRFTKGWGDVKSDEYWSYAFLWFLNSKPVINAATLEKSLNAYYDGLIGRNIERRKIPKEKIFPVKSIIKKIATVPGDSSTFSGTVYMLDYMEQKPNTLNCTIHLKYCTGKDNTFLFYELSPQPATHAVWKTLDKLWKAFDCKEAVEK
jgi:hypothetical protein